MTDIVLIIIAVIIVIAIWNLVLSIQNMKIKEIEEKKDYYGRLK